MDTRDESGWRAAGDGGSTDWTNRARLISLGMAIGHLMFAPLPAYAQATDGEGLTLRESLRAAVRRGAEVLLAEQAIVAATAGSELAAGAFGSRIETFATVSDERGSSGSTTGETATASESERAVGYGLRLDKLSRTGLVVRPLLSVTTTDGGLSTGYTFAEAQMSLIVPVLRGRGGGVAAASERAAVLEMESSILASHHASAATALSTLMAYWGYRASVERLDVLRASEGRAIRAAEETEALIAADERAPADLYQLLANVANRRSQRIGSEQAVAESRRNLGLEMGVEAAEIAMLPPPTTDFPTTMEVGPALDTLFERLAAGTEERRWDLSARRQQGRAARERLAGAQGELRPSFDLEFGVSVGALGAQGSGAPLAPNLDRVMGPSARVGVTYQFTNGRRSAIGATMQQEAAVQQLEIQYAELRRAAESAVQTAAAAVRSNLAELGEIEEAVGHAQRAVEGETARFRLGTATQIDLIFAEDALTSALLSQIDARVRYAQSLARLQFEAGALVEVDSGTVSVWPLAVPAFDPTTPTATSGTQ